MNQITVITGAASGIGRALAEIYLKNGAKVVALDLNMSPLENFKGHAYRADVTNADELQSVAEKINQEVGRPTHWINSAGIAILGAFETLSAEQFQKVMAVNFGGTVNGTRTALSLMKNPTSGTIVNMASVSSIVPAPFMCAYSASKHAVAGFTRSLRMEYEQNRSELKILLVVPGFVKTLMMEAQPEFHLPKWLDFMVASPESTALKIYKGIQKNQKEIFPTQSGRALLNLYRIAPELCKSSTRLALAKNWRQLVGLDPIGPKR